MTRPWTRDDTKEWINQLEHRLEDIEYYLQKTAEWCDEYGIDDDRLVFLCSFLTCIWVSHMRGEFITQTELMELLGVQLQTDSLEDKIYELDDKWGSMDHEELLERAVKVFDSDDNLDDYFES